MIFRPHLLGLVCDVLPTPAHASVKLSGDGDGRVAMTITCAPGLHVVGSAHMVCHPHGNGRPGGVWRIDASNTSRLATTPVCAGESFIEFSVLPILLPYFRSAYSAVAPVCSPHWPRLLLLSFVHLAYAKTS